MNQFKNLALSLVASSIFLISGATNANAQSEPDAGDPGSEESAKMECPTGWQPWPEKLELTDDQMETLVSLKSDFEIKIAEKKAHLMADMEQMMLLMTAPKLDKAAILSLSEKINSLRTEIATARVNKMLDAMAVMTEKQKEQMHHHMLTHMLSHGQHHEMHGMHHHHGPEHH